MFSVLFGIDFNEISLYENFFHLFDSLAVTRDRKKTKYANIAHHVFREEFSPLDSGDVPSIFVSTC